MSVVKHGKKLRKYLGKALKKQGVAAVDAPEPKRKSSA
jgi:hypothetical protein